MTAPAPNTTPTPKLVEGVAYFSIEGAPHQFFRCEPFRATLSTTACAARWSAGQKASGAAGDRFERCRGCAIGAAHAGQPYVYRSPLFGLSICPRTRRWTSRMPNGRLGISSYNREREFILRRNAKGRPPLFRLDPRRLAIILDGRERIELRDPLTADSIEMPVQVLRVAIGRAVFTRARPNAPAISTIEFAARFQAQTGDDTKHQHAIKAAAARARAMLADGVAAVAMAAE